MNKKFKFIKSLVELANYEKLAKVYKDDNFLCSYSTHTAQQVAFSTSPTNMCLYTHVRVCDVYMYVRVCDVAQFDIKAGYANIDLASP